MTSLEQELLSAPADLQANLKNIYAYFSSLSPLYISAYLLISSVSNGDIGKAGMFLAGLVLVLLIHSIIAMSIGGEYEKTNSSKYKLECNFIQMPLLSNYMIPNLNSTLLAFIFTYLIMPMQTYNSYNVILLGIVGAFFGVNAISKIMHGCTTMVGILISVVIGFLMGFLWYSIVITSNPKLLFFAADGGEPICSRPSKQTFKCKVYKNGEVIHTI
jgi:magnesium-transporting ATPase (P-type)